MLPCRCLRSANVEARRYFFSGRGRRQRGRLNRLPIPLEARAQHEVYDVAILYGVFFEQLSVCESLATQEKTLRVCRGRPGLPRELRFDIGYRIRRADFGERKSLGWFGDFESYGDRFWLCGAM